MGDLDLTSLEASSMISEAITSSCRICEQTRLWFDGLTTNGRLPVGTLQVDNLISLPHICIGDFTFLICNRVSNPISDQVDRKKRRNSQDISSARR